MGNIAEEGVSFLFVAGKRFRHVVDSSCKLRYFVVPGHGDLFAEIAAGIVLRRIHYFGERLCYASGYRINGYKGHEKHPECNGYTDPGHLPSEGNARVILLADKDNEVAVIAVARVIAVHMCGRKEAVDRPHTVSFPAGKHCKRHGRRNSFGRDIFIAVEGSDQTAVSIENIYFRTVFGADMLDIFHDGEIGIQNTLHIARRTF